MHPWATTSKHLHPLASTKHNMSQTHVYNHRIFLTKDRRYHRKDILNDRTSINKAVEKGDVKNIPSKRKGYSVRILSSVSQVASPWSSPHCTLTNLTSLLRSFYTSDPRMNVGARLIVASHPTSTSLSMFGSTTSAVSCNTSANAIRETRREHH